MNKAPVTLTDSVVQGKKEKALILPRAIVQGEIIRIVFVSHARSRSVVLLTNEDNLFA